MSVNTSIQWAHTTVNPVMGCTGCELYPSTSQVARTMLTTAVEFGAEHSMIQPLIEQETIGGPQTVKLRLKEISQRVALQISSSANRSNTGEASKAIHEAVSKLFVCYAATLHRTFNTNGKNPGYAHPFEAPRTFSGRLAKVALMGAPAPEVDPRKPWICGYRRMIFVSDMGDALSPSIPFEFLRKEIINPINSIEGQRHMWLWLSKRPARMAEFSTWLSEQGVSWPSNLVAMTSVTSQKTAPRVAELLKIKSRYHALSVEPLWEKVSLPLAGIDWVIVGGESGPHAHPFHTEWLEHLGDECQREGSAFFAKQLGRKPFHRGKPLLLKDAHGGEWNEWPEHLRIREIPNSWRTIP